MNQIDIEIEVHRNRIAYLEKQKEAELKKKAIPLETLERIINEKKKQIENNRYSKSIPLARFYDQEKIGYLEPILDILKNMQERLNALENKKEIKVYLLSNIN